MRRGSDHLRTRIPVWMLEQARRLGTSEAELGERSASLARILVEPRSFRVERGGPVVAVGAHEAVVGLKTPTTQAGFLTAICTLVEE